MKSVDTPTAKNGSAQKKKPSTNGSGGQRGGPLLVDENIRKPINFMADSVEPPSLASFITPLTAINTNGLASNINTSSMGQVDHAVHHIANHQSGFDPLLQSQLAPTEEQNLAYYQEFSRLFIANNVLQTQVSSIFDHIGTVFR